jgi:drug/metabolite transporter (DMT)-like permease
LQLQRSTHLKGIAVSTAGVIAISPDSLLIRLIGADVWTLSLWRGLLLALTLAVVQLLRHRAGIVACYVGMGRRDLLAGVLSEIGTICFVSAITYTTVANVLILLGATPLVTALMGRAFLGEIGTRAHVGRHRWRPRRDRHHRRRCCRRPAAWGSVCLRRGVVYGWLLHRRTVCR